MNSIDTKFDDVKFRYDIAHYQRLHTFLFDFTKIYDFTFRMQYTSNSNQGCFTQEGRLNDLKYNWVGQVTT